MKLAITGWRTQIASDVVRDGLGVELLNAAGDVVAEVFRSDVDGAMTLNTFNNPLPVDVVDRLISIARDRLPPSGDDADGSA